jgi:hypothetical protein
MHTLDHPRSIGLKAVFVIDAIWKIVLLIDAIPVETIILLSRKLSMVFMRRPGYAIELRSSIRSLSLDGRGLG